MTAPASRNATPSCPAISPNRWPMRRDFSVSAFEHLRVAGELGERRRRDQKDPRRAAVRAFAIGADEKDEARGALGDIEGGHGEPFLQVIAAERKNDEVDRRMAHEARRQRVRA